MKKTTSFVDGGGSSVETILKFNFLKFKINDGDKLWKNNSKKSINLKWIKNLD